MNRNVSTIVAVCFLVLSAFMTVMAVNQSEAAEEVAITGTVNPSGQLVMDDGKSFFIEPNDAGRMIVALAGKKVEVKGVVSGEEDAKTITVNSYEEIR